VITIQALSPHARTDAVRSGTLPAGCTLDIKRVRICGKLSYLVWHTLPICSEQTRLQTDLHVAKHRYIDAVHYLGYLADPPSSPLCTSTHSPSCVACGRSAVAACLWKFLKDC